MKSLLASLIALSALTASAQTVYNGTLPELKTKVDVTMNFKNCRDAGYLRAAYLSEDEWVVDFIQNDSDVIRKNTKSYEGKRLDEMTADRSYSFYTKIHPDINFGFRLREVDNGYFDGDDDKYFLEEFTPSYEMDIDLTCLEHGDCEQKTFSFMHVVPGAKEGRECLKAKFKVSLE